MNDQAGAQRKRLSKTSALDPATGKFKKAQSAFSVAEDLLAQSEEWHRALIETASRAGLGIVVWQDTPDREAAVVFANDEFCRMLGYSREELFNMLISEYVRESDLEKSLATYRRRQQGENVVSLHEATYVRKDGTLLTAENSVALMRYQGKTATVAFVTDISERKMAEQELTKHRHQLE
ncbi:MAG: PAS domain S-box protein, partial [Dehalococcoidia bacterium]|nr:PAS domain S-box protein [Dehalococcoidia bacterium]